MAATGTARCRSIQATTNEAPDVDNVRKNLWSVNLTNLKTTRSDSTVNFDWGSSVPSGTSITDGDSFSVRWSGAIQTRYSELYTFYLSRDNGARLWIGGALLIDEWKLDGRKRARTRSGHPQFSGWPEVSDYT